MKFIIYIGTYTVVYIYIIVYAIDASSSHEANKIFIYIYTGCQKFQFHRAVFIQSLCDDQMTMTIKLHFSRQPILQKLIFKWFNLCFITI